MAHDVFISYSHVDKAVADAICARLEQDGARCWYAPRDIEPGADWAGSIIDALEHTKIMVLVFTDFSNSSRQVLREVNNAVRTGAVIVPFRLTEKSPSGGMRYYLSSVHWLDALNEPLEQSIEELSGVVRSVLGGSSAPSSPDPDVSTAQTAPSIAVVATNKRPKWLIPVCAALALLVCAAAVLFAGRTKEERLPTPQAVNETAEPSEPATEQPLPVQAAEQKPAETENASDSDAVLTDSAAGEDPENYIYKTYTQSVVLNKYFGAADAVVTVPAQIDGLPVTEIDERCFENHTEIEKLVLPDTVSTIGYRAMYGCTGLKEINFPDSLLKIGGWAFAYDAFSDAVLPDSLRELGYGAFYSCLRLETVVTPEQVAAIGEDSFRGCARLKQVTILAPDPEIHNNAFAHDSGVTLIGVPGSYTEKYARAFGLKFEAAGD